MIHHVQLASPPGSEAASRAFYAGLLGLAEKPKPPLLAARGGCWFIGYPDASAPRDEAQRSSVGHECPRIELHLGVEADFRPARKAHPALLWPALDALAQRLAAAGHPVRWPDQAELPGLRRFYTDDPHGNRLEFLAPVPSTVDA